MSSKENRQAARINHDSVLEIYDAGGHFITGIGRLVNFSKVGVCFSSTKALRVGDRLQARLRLLREGTVEVSAHIVWSKKKPNAMLYGVAFDDVKKIRH
jgi:hypothetical protein